MTDSSVAPLQIRETEFASEGITLRGVVSVPVGPGPFPVVVMAHGMGGLKEWTIPELAQRLGRAGFASLSFDYRNFGASGGAPREEIDHPGQIEDWMNAITCAAGLPEAVGAPIGLWGTSLGGRNVLAAAAQDWGRVSAVVVQVPATVPMQLQLMMGMMFSGMSDVSEFLAELTADRNDRAAGLEPRYYDFDPAPEPGPDAVEHAEYWATFGEAERRNWTPRLSLRSLEPSAAMDVAPLVAHIAPTPLLMILADGDAMIEEQQGLFEQAGEPKELLTVAGHHYSVYTTHKDTVLTAAVNWFSEHLQSEPDDGVVDRRTANRPR